MSSGTRCVNCSARTYVFSQCPAWIYIYIYIYIVYSIHKPYEGRGKTVAGIRHAGQTEGCRATEVAVLMRYA